MGIEYGSEVFDKNDRKIGTVNRVIRDTYTTEIKKFTVSSEFTDVDLFFSPEEVQEATASRVKLGIALDEGKSLEVEYGAEVVDKKGKKLGTVDYTVRDTLTGEIRSFKVSTLHSKEDLLFSTEDVSEVTPTSVKLNISIDKSNQVG